MEWYKFDLVAYDRATADLNLREHGVYRRLLDLYYQSEKPLLNNRQWLVRQLSIGHKWDSQALVKVLSRYFILDTSDGCYHNSRADAEIAEYKGRSEQNRVNAKHRWNGADGNASRTATAMPIQTVQTVHTKTLEKPASKPVDNSCQHHMENGEVCGKVGTHKLHPSSKDWFCRIHLNG